MDPRNPLGRLERLSREPGVARLSLVLDDGGRAVEVETKDGGRVVVRARPHSTYVELLDRVARVVRGGAR